MKAALMMLVGVLLVGACDAAEPCPPAERQEAWAASCFGHTAQGRQVKPAYRGRIAPDRSGHFLILIDEPSELVAVDRLGMVVVPGIAHAGDFDYRPGRIGLVRYRSGGKCGYFDARSFQIRIPAIYDQCLAVREEQPAVVCNACQMACTEPECQNGILIGGQGLELDARNRVLRRYALPALAQACNGAPPARFEQHPAGSLYLQCPAEKNGPFTQLR